MALRSAPQILQVAKELFVQFHKTTVPVRETQAPYVRRYGVKFQSEPLSFSTTVYYKTAPARDVDHLERFGVQKRAGIFAGFHSATAGWWKGGYEHIGYDDHLDGSGLLNHGRSAWVFHVNEIYIIRLLTP